MSDTDRSEKSPFDTAEPRDAHIRVYQYVTDGDTFVFEQSLIDGDFVRFFSVREALWRKFVRKAVRKNVLAVKDPTLRDRAIRAYKEYVAIAGMPAIRKAVPEKRIANSAPSGIAPAATLQPAAPSYPVSGADLEAVQNHLAISSRPLFVTGRAGTGKSTILKSIASRKAGSCIVLAPTGTAALNARGMTIHRFFGFPLRPLSRGDVKRGEWCEVAEKAEVVILDEVSMVRADTLDAISEALQLATDNSAPFGGKSIALFGDPYQLPAFVTREEAPLFRAAGYTNPHFFKATALEVSPPVTLELQTVYRQTDTRFIEILDRVRTGRASSADIVALNERVRPRAAEELDDAMMLTTRRDRAEEINKRQLAGLPGSERSFVANVTGTFRGDVTTLPAPRELRLKRGARVMFVRNDALGRWVNGSLGEVADLSSASVTVELDDGAVVLVSPEEWQQTDYEVDADTDDIVERVVGSYRQIPLQLGWAATVHKSQGLTLDRVHLDLGDGAFADGQLYVALSRCRTFDGITLEVPVRTQDIRVDRHVLAFMGR